MENLEFILRYVLCFLAIAVIFNCVLSLIRLRPEKKTYALLVDVTNDEQFPITCYETSIGRSKSCDIVFSNMTVSRSHAVIALRKDGFYVFDTDSKTGIHVNGEKIEKPKKIFNGDVIAFGTAVLNFYIGSEADDDMSHKKDAPIARATLTNLADDNVFRLEGDFVTIGRRKGSNIEISAPYVSREHAELTLQKNRWIIENFSSVTATTLNGEVIYSPTALENGDIIEIGDFAFRYNENR
ncbi:MAG: FHA domain-containing protein [Clostridia bacterium]|nr:FHA domain-containing protein [Clostridia bacterium]